MPILTAPLCYLIGGYPIKAGRTTEVLLHAACGIYNKVLPLELKEDLKRLPDIVQEPPSRNFV